MLETVFLLVMASVVIWLAHRKSPARDRIVNRELLQLRRRRIGEIGEGLVRVVGKARPLAEPLVAPLSGRACVAFRLDIIENHELDGWRAVVEHQEGVPFMVVDDTGEVRVPFGAADIALVPDVTGRISGSFPELCTEFERQVFRIAGTQVVEDLRKSGEPRAFRYEEAILGVDQLVAVGGLAMRELDTDAERPTSRVVGERLVFERTPDHPLLISTLPELLS